MARSVTLSEMISNLKAEIKSAQTSGETMFELGTITIKTKIVIKSTGKKGAKVNVYVLTADLSSEEDAENSHEVTIELKPKEPVLMGEDKRA